MSESNRSTKQKQFLLLAEIVITWEKWQAKPYTWNEERELDRLCIEALAAGCSYRQVADARGNDLTRQTIGNRYS